MNKIKVLYDVVTTMKSKETVKGKVEVEAKKDNEKIFGFENEFERSNETGYCKAKINSEVNCEGRSVKHESSTEFTMRDSQDHHGFMRHMHHMHKHQHRGMGVGGPKECLNRIGFALGLLNAIKLEENDDKSLLMTLNLKDMPEEMKKVLHEKMETARSSEDHHKFEDFEGQEHSAHCAFMKELHGIAAPEIEAKFWINNNKEVERITITANGKGNEETGGHTIDLIAELNMIW